jgi:hypothetical protein
MPINVPANKQMKRKEFISTNQTNGEDQVYRAAFAGTAQAFRVFRFSSFGLPGTCTPHPATFRYGVFTLYKRKKRGPKLADATTINAKFLARNDANAEAFKNPYS